MLPVHLTWTYITDELLENMVQALVKVSDYKFDHHQITGIVIALSKLEFLSIKQLELSMKLWRKKLRSVFILCFSRHILNVISIIKQLICVIKNK